MVLTEKGRRELEAAYREWGADVWRAVFAYSGGVKEVADEAVAEAFAQAGRGLQRIKTLRPWVYTTAFRLAARELRDRGQNAPLGDGRPGTVDLGSTVEVLDLIRRLSPNQRAAFTLRHVFGFSTRETATLASMSEVAVRVHLHAARRRLQGPLREEVEP